jgi:H+/Cl- antiporter ClcA
MQDADTTPDDAASRGLVALRRARLFLVAIGAGAIVGVLAGIASGVFLVALERATLLRLRDPRLVYLLPIAGLVIGALYERIGKPVKGGYALILDTLHAGGPRIPLRMAPLVLVGTVLTHLFGGSAGREGTAVQMGASLADTVAHALGLDAHARRQLVTAGIAGGFGSVFGTPVAGLVFALEVTRVGRVDYGALLPALAAAIVGDYTTRALGVHHTEYPLVAPLGLAPIVVGKWIVFGVAAGLVALAFVEALRSLKRVLDARIASAPLRMFAGGVAVIALWQLVGNGDYLGLGVPSIVRAFSDVHQPWAAFAWKGAFTVVTLAAGYLGGEVTPLFFVGATLGNALGRALGLPLDLAAACGMSAVFGAAANTPLALAIMAVELVGAHALPHVIVVNVVAYVVSGHRGIYSAQRVARAKLGARTLAGDVALRDWRHAHERDATRPVEPEPHDPPPS